MMGRTGRHLCFLAQQANWEHGKPMLRKVPHSQESEETSIGPVDVMTVFSFIMCTSSLFFSCCLTCLNAYGVTKEKYSVSASLIDCWIGTLEEMCLNLLSILLSTLSTLF